MKKCFKILLVSILVILCSISILLLLSPKTQTFGEIVREYGYQSKVHTVETPDGYLLDLMRVAPNTKDSKQDEKITLLLQHGLFDSADDAVMNGDYGSPAFYYTDLGYDVWLSNNRGNRYSRNHVSYNPNTDRKFWNFSIDDYAVDLRSNIEYILNYTNKTQVALVGHSIGTAESFMAMSEDPDWFEEHVSIMVALAPISRHTSCHNNPEPKNPTITKLYTGMFDVVRNIMLGEMSGSNSLFNSITYSLCYNMPNFCNYALKFMSDSDPSKDNIKSVGEFLSHFPAGSSLKVLQHMTQMSRSCKFAAFDYGPEGNIVVYNSTEPKEYNLKQIKVPIALIMGQNDLVSPPDTSEWLEGQIKNVLVYSNTYPLGHVGFFVAKNMQYMSDIHRLIQEHHPKETAEDSKVKSKRGLFIVFEGLDRSGKSTRVSKLYEILSNNDTPVVKLKFPNTDFESGQKLKDNVKNKISLYTSEQILILFATNIWEMSSKIHEYIQKGITVICGRYAYSGMAYAKGGDIEVNESIIPNIGLPQPDIVFFTNVTAEVASKRADYGGTAYETVEFQSIIYQGFNEIQPLEPNWVTLPSFNDDLEKVFSYMEEIVMKKLDELSPSEDDIPNTLFSKLQKS